MTKNKPAAKKEKYVADISKISNIRWDKYYAKKQHEMADKIAKIFAKSKIVVDPKVPMIIAKGLVQRKKKAN